MSGLRDLLRPDGPVARWRTWAKSPDVQRAGLIVALLVFAVGVYVAARSFELPPDGINVAPLILLAFLGVPATVLLNTLEMELSARLVRRRFGLAPALSTTIMASAANMLPLPGAMMVRFAGLASLGATAGESAKVTLGIALLWVGLGIGVTGAFLAHISGLISTAAVLAGLIICGISIQMLGRISGQWAAAFLCLGVKAVMVIVSIVRLMLAFAAIGVAVPFTEGAVFAVSGVAGSAVSVVPAGLGVRELVSAALAPLTSIEPSAAFLATAADRLVELVVLLVLAAPLALFVRRKPAIDEA